MSWPRHDRISFERSLREATGQSSLDDKTAITLRELERTAAVNKSLFEDFLQRAKITQEQSTFEARDARVITPAMAPGAPSSPKKTQFMTLALIMGLFLGVGGAVAKDKLNGGFATPRQIEDMLQVPLLTSVNVMNSRDYSQRQYHPTAALSDGHAVITLQRSYPDLAKRNPDGRRGSSSESHPVDVDYSSRRQDDGGIVTRGIGGFFRSQSSVY